MNRGEPPDRPSEIDRAPPQLATSGNSDPYNYCPIAAVPERLALLAGALLLEAVPLAGVLFIGPTKFQLERVSR